MSPLEKIQNLLINDDIPSQELINYLVDDVVDDMTEKYLTCRGDNNNKSTSSDMGALIDSSRKLVATNNALTIYAKKKDFEQKPAMQSSSFRAR